MPSDDKTPRSPLQRRNPLSPAVIADPKTAPPSERLRRGDGPGAADEKDSTADTTHATGATERPKEAQEIGPLAKNPEPDETEPGPESELVDRGRARRQAARQRRDSASRDSANQDGANQDGASRDSADKSAGSDDSESAPTVVATRYQNFSDFYSDHADPIYRALTVTLGDPVLAADATSEAMTRACQRWASVRDGSNPPGWVYRVGLNWSRSRWRKLRRERPLDHRLEVELPDLDTTATVVQEAVARLPLNQRSVVVLRFYLQWTPTEIAASLDIAVGTVKSRLHRGLAAMREDLADLELDGLDDLADLSDDDDVPDNNHGSSQASDEIDLTSGKSGRNAIETDAEAADVDLRSRQRSIGRARSRKERR